MKIKISSSCLFALCVLFFANCKTKNIPRQPGKTNKPKTEKPATGGIPIDTIRWSENTGGKPPISSEKTNPNGSSGGPAPGGDFSKQKFRVAFLMPFLTNQVETAPGGVPERSAKAVQFYAGAKIALEQLSEIEGMNLAVDVFDTQINDADFAALLKNPKLELADVFIGPFRSTHVDLLGKNWLAKRKIIVSPESPNENLVAGNPSFLQLSPSLKTHCEAMLQFVRAKSPGAEVVLVCRERETERLAWFQNLNSRLGGNRFPELVLPDATTNMAKNDLKIYLKPGKKTVFFVPSFSSQDFVFAFLRQLKSQIGRNEAEVFGLPQWLDFENIEPEYFESLKVHVTAPSFTDFSASDVRVFSELFYQNYGTVPSDDAFNGYDTVLFTGKMLKKYGLDFPEKSVGQTWQGIKGKIKMGKNFADGNNSPDRSAKPDYLENKFLHILKFEGFQFSPVD